MSGIDADRWRRLRPLLDHALDLDGNERDAYVRTLRRDEDLRGDLERFLAEHERLQRLVLPSAARLVIGDLASEFWDLLKADDFGAGEHADGVP
jgi:hypothetical protein